MAFGISATAGRKLDSRSDGREITEHHFRRRTRHAAKRKVLLRQRNKVETHLLGEARFANQLAKPVRVAMPDLRLLLGPKTEFQWHFLFLDSRNSKIHGARELLPRFGQCHAANQLTSSFNLI
jgi:hypothetical protein